MDCLCSRGSCWCKVHPICICTRLLLISEHSGYKQLWMIFSGPFFPGMLLFLACNFYKCKALEQKCFYECLIFRCPRFQPKPSHFLRSDWDVLASLLFSRISGYHPAFVTFPRGFTFPSCLWYWSSVSFFDMLSHPLGHGVSVPYTVSLLHTHILTHSRLFLSHPRAGWLNEDLYVREES